MSERTRDIEDFYCIRLAYMRDQWGPDPKNPKRTIIIDKIPGSMYFKADRYSPYSGRLQTEHDPELAQKFKTVAGAWKAVDRLIEKGTIRPDHDPVVVRYRRVEVITEVTQPRVIAESVTS